MLTCMLVLSSSGDNIDINVHLVFWDLGILILSSRLDPSFKSNSTSRKSIFSNGDSRDLAGKTCPMTLCHSIMNHLATTLFQ